MSSARNERNVYAVNIEETNGEFRKERTKFFCKEKTSESLMEHTITNSCTRSLQIVVQDRYKQLYKTVTNSCTRPLQTVVQDRYSCYLQTVEAKGNTLK